MIFCLSPTVVLWLYELKGNLLCLFLTSYFYSGTLLKLLCMSHSSNIILIYLILGLGAAHQFVTCINQAVLCISADWQSNIKIWLKQQIGGALCLLTALWLSVDRISDICSVRHHTEPRLEKTNWKESFQSSLNPEF